ncbi:GTP 3',8-cyclase MoaA [Alteribacter natronophilus]|uniref:GTP 3',8-cyclase MoaA n=1 Tax=Alteribacter natronophilus TaxID=2583810 RepID=UPI00110E88F9|nr:GTP 3',8-cyclase MoaA [Alteribacter natronophilus]TMW72071.1 GTP 3',8-cyclase MoaA [Alteribacter natronophilus]
MKQEQQAYDALFRPLKDLRISVTDQCNFRCSYCMPAEIFGPDYQFMKEDELLSFDEIVRLAGQFARLGVEKIRITGGEPLLRKGLPDLIRSLKTIDGIKDVALTTNGVYLVRQAEALREAGLDRVNVSLDAIEDSVFRKMNGRNVPVKPVLKGIRRAQEAGLEVKVNMVVKKGANESQIVPMARYFKGSNVILRFIEFMDVGNTNGWKFDSVVSKKEIVDRIAEAFPVEPAGENYYGEVADRFVYSDGGGEIGVISSVSDSFCSSCTRARLSADGKLFTCLFAVKGEDIRARIRSGIDDRELYDMLADVWKNRHDRYSDERTEETVKERKNGRKIEMSYIGG